MDVPVADAPPQEPTVTAYDRDHLKLYMRLLDADRAGASWHEAATAVLGLDPSYDPERAQSIHAAHLARARWMVEQGYKDFLKSE